VPDLGVKNTERSLEMSAHFPDLEDLEIHGIN
jgi:hypothetical protein